MELVLQFWSLPFQFLSNALTNLLVLVAKYPGVSWDPSGLAWVSLGPFWDSLRTAWDPSMDQIHGSDPWIRSYNWLFDVILILSIAIVCFRASRANFLRSITKAIVNKNDGKRIIDLLTSFCDFQKLSFVFAPLGLTFCALSFVFVTVGNV